LNKNTLYLNYIVKRRSVYRVLVILFIIAGSCACILYGLSSSIEFFQKPSQLIADKNIKSVRLGGFVKSGSIVYHDVNNISFIITDNIVDIVVEYSGMIPKLFRDNQGVIIKGQLISDKFIATQILAKHDERYTPSKILLK
jgi:cytochrome c-type biogenesis protein CcmE